MKSFTTRIAAASTLAVALLVSSLSPVLAFDSYDSGVQVQNLEGVAGTVDLLSYTEAGVESVVVSDDPIAANGSNTYFATTAIKTDCQADRRQAHGPGNKSAVRSGLDRLSPAEDHFMRMPRSGLWYFAAFLRT